MRLANLRYHIGKGVWEPDSSVDAVLANQISKIYIGRELAHLSWNPTGNELAICDIFGRLCIFTSLLHLNRISAVKGWMNDPEDDLNALVGMIWLNADRPQGVRPSSSVTYILDSGLSEPTDSGTSLGNEEQRRSMEYSSFDIQTQRPV